MIYIESPNFQKKLASLRRKYVIPSSGFPGYKTQDVSIISAFYSPIKWIHASNRTQKRNFNRDLRKTTEPFELGMDDFWTSLFRVYAFHNIIDRKMFSINVTKNYLMGIKDICSIQKIHEDLRDFLEFGDNTYLANLLRLSETHPVAIFLSPAASQREVREIIAKKWPVIEMAKLLAYDVDYNSLQRRTYGSSLSLKKIKVRTTRKRDALIYSKRERPRREIAHFVQKKFGGSPLSDQYINLIISREKKRQALEAVIDRMIRMEKKEQQEL